MTLLIENINKYVSNKFMKAFVKIINMPIINVTRKKTMTGFPRYPSQSLEG